jgi:hypothetical protein
MSLLTQKTNSSSDYIILPEDVLTISCASYRLSKSQNQHFGVNANLAGKINDTDRLLADKVRQHYLDKLLVAILKGEVLTKFRQDLQLCLNTDFKQSDGTYKFPGEFVGLIIKLPYFYHNDLMLHNIFNEVHYEIKGDDKGEKRDRSLTFIQTIDTEVKHRSCTEYWCSDEHNNRVCFEIDKINPLKKLLDYMLALDNQLVIYSSYIIRKRDGFVFYYAGNPMIIPKLSETSVVFR